MRFSRLLTGLMQFTILQLAPSRANSLSALSHLRQRRLLTLAHCRSTSLTIFVDVMNVLTRQIWFWIHGASQRQRLSLRRQRDHVDLRVVGRVAVRRVFVMHAWLHIPPYGHQ